MSALDLDALEALCDGATPGPWKVVDAHTVMDPAGFCVAGTEWESDGAFIAAARDAVPALITRLRAAEALTAWQPIETAPRDGTAVLVWWLLSTSDAGGIACFNGERWTQRDGLPYTWAPTHWMPLPAAPEAP